MSTLETLASNLADETVKLMKETGDDRLYVEVSTLIGASSQTLEEAYLSEVRVRLAAIGAKQFLAQKRSEAQATRKPKPTAQA